MSTITQTIAPIPGLPSGVDATPETYPPAAQAFADRLEDVPGELNALAAQMNTVAGEVNANAQTAVTKAAECVDSANTTAGFRDTAQIYMQQAQLETPAAWNPATAYTFPQCVAGSTGFTYRCVSQTPVTGLDPVSNGATWVKISSGLLSGAVKQFFLSQA